MDINELQSFKLSDAVKFHDELNPNLWTKDGKLLPEVQEQLEKIAEDFVVSLGISDLKVKDITISGSNAAYSYTPHSDLDLHVLVDFNELPNDEVYKELFNAKKTVYNDTHDIKINNIPVELYVQDTNQKHTSLGEYSIKNKDWIKFPIKRRANLDQKETKLKYEKLGNLIELAITLKDLSRIDKVLDTLKRYRRAGLEKTGEFGPENLAYKLIRKQGLLQALIDTKNEVHSQNLSLPEDQVLEVTDTSEALDLKKLVTDPKKLKTYDTHLSPQEAYQRLLKGEKDEYLIRAIAKAAWYSYLYAKDVLKKPFPLGEPAIAKNVGRSFSYSYNVLEKPFPLGEPAIAKDAWSSYKYARYILKGPFPLGEPAIAKDAMYSYLYATYVLEGKPWTGLKKKKKKKVDEALDLKKLVDDPKKLQTHDTHIGPEEAYYRLIKDEKEEYLFRAIATDAYYSYRYAIKKLKPFPLGEPTIAKDPEYSYRYAMDVLKGPFPLGEPAIAKNAWYSYLYARYVLEKPFPLGEPAIFKDYRQRDDYKKHVLKGKPWTGLPWTDPKKKVDEAIDLKKLVSDPKKLKTHEKYIGPVEAYRRLKKGETDEYLLRAVSKDAMYSCKYAEDVLKGPFPLGEPTIAKDAEYSYHYATEILKGPFPLGEPAIAKHGILSYAYALTALRGPFPLGEPAIYHNDIRTRRLYEQYVLKGKPWTNIDQKVDEAIDLKKLVSDPKKLTNLDRYVEPKTMINNIRDYAKKNNGIVTTEMLKILIKEIGKEASPKIKQFYSKLLKAYSENGIEGMAKNIDFAINYIYFVRVRCPILEPILATRAKKAFLYAHYLRKPFPLGEPAISKSSEASYRYAKYDLKGPFPKGEPAIAKDGWFSYDYAVSVIKKPFPLGEPVIYDSALRKDYEKYVLKGRPWTNKKKKKVDEAIDLKNLVSDPKKLKTHKTHISPKEALNKLKQGATDEYLLKAVATDPNASYLYAGIMIKGPWQPGEPAIAKSTEDSFWYARKILKKPFPLGEPAIAKDASYAYEYAMNVLKGSFPLGEPIIAENPGVATLYAMDVLKGPFPLGEPTIAKSATYSYHYAKDILKGPFPLGEPAIYHSYYKDRYEKEILQGKPWTGLDQKVDEAIDLKNLVSDPKKLKTVDTHISADEALEKLRQGDKNPLYMKVILKSPRYCYIYAKDILKGPFPKGEPTIAKDPRFAWMYAERVLKNSFPLGEPTIAKDAMASKDYALYVLKGPFTLGEPAIATDAYYAMLYAKYILKGPFPLGEPAIAKNPESSDVYAREVIKGPWPLGEPAIARSSPLSLRYARKVLKGPFPKGERSIARSASNSYFYAREVLEDSFPKGERVISKNAEYSYWYAKDVLKGPFPKGEPAIASSMWRNNYQRDILKGKPWTGLDQQVTESLDLKKLVDDPTKLKTVDTHISPKEAYRRLKKGETDDLLVHVVAKSPEYSFYYALNVLKGPFPLGEPAIRKDSNWSFDYSYDILKGKPWTGLDQKVTEAIDLKNLVDDPAKLQTYDTHLNAVETVKYKIENGIAPTKEDLIKIYNETNKLQGTNSWLTQHSWRNQQDKILNFNDILKSGKFSYLFAKNILNGPFPLGEPAIAEDAKYSYRYANDVLKKIFPLGEPAIAKSAEYSCYYAGVLKGPFTLGEPAIAKNGWYSYLYAKEVLKKPFSLGEPAIYKSKWKTDYEIHVLKGKPWTGLDQPVTKTNIDESASGYIPSKKEANTNEMAKKKSTRKETISDEQYLNDWLINYFLEFPQPIALISAENTYSDFTYICNMHIDPYLWVADDLSEIRVDKVQDIRNYLGKYSRKLFDTFLNQTHGYPGLDTEIFKVARNDSNTLTAKQAQMQLHQFNHGDTGNSIHESASGYIPSKKEKNDPRYKTALTRDVGPDTMQQNAKKLGWKISRRGTPPLLFKPKA